MLVPAQARAVLFIAEKQERGRLDHVPRQFIRAGPQDPVMRNKLGEIGFVGLMPAARCGRFGGDAPPRREMLDRVILPRRSHAAGRNRDWTSKHRIGDHDGVVDQA